ncbi:MAG TPA: sigma-70 family RNA polymerase sigma factor [Polyangia bacterium]|nr:sigma-70 family RNA polymerase sigma factor [Polyangia bacterium]
MRSYAARRLPNAADVDDVVQEVLVRVYQGLGGLKDDERFGPWVYRIAERAIADVMRVRDRVPLAPGPGGPPEQPDQAGADTDDAADLRSALAGCVTLFVARLPSPYREAVTLTELQGLSQRDAADVAGISLSGMKSRVQRGRERLFAMFQRCCEVSLDCRRRVIGCEPRHPRGVAEECPVTVESWTTAR